MATSPAHRLRLAIDMYEVGEQMLRQRLRRERPDAPDAEIDDAIAAWRLRRPGAPTADSPGHLSPRFG